MRFSVSLVGKEPAFFVVNDGKDHRFTLLQMTIGLEVDRHNFIQHPQRIVLAFCICGNSLTQA